MMNKGKRTVECRCRRVFHNLGKLRRHIENNPTREGEPMHIPNLEHENTAKSVKRYEKARKREEKANHGHK